MKKTAVVLSFFAIFLLTACSGSGIRGDLDQVLNDTFDAEEEYRAVQDDLEKREKTEQQLFEEIMALTQEEQDQVAKQAQTALDSADERLEFLKTEKESMQSAEENFTGIDKVIKAAEEVAVKADVEALKTKMKERFTAHSEFTKAYEKLIERQKELYEMLKKEETTLQLLQEKAAEVNEQNEQVQLAVTAFNEITKQVNELKDATMKKIDESEE
ncbi:YkyA family protein [Planococcus faecalis]|uniref:Cell-wall binding lipoprotein n=1 Tax=Planococcus faecalis TaxID=1598147 RepID=A0ABM6ITP3_9BACL|nr:YkyA family protein [Planococcus faecalis]AQU79950.1 hypothetical protein AJGP001_11990 [Planococcus faecalis]OHX53403.1 hypothetical protein BB777_09300 [Planococcus faecalis]